MIDISVETENMTVVMKEMTVVMEEYKTMLEIRTVVNKMTDVIEEGA
jgi:hypothetical protein